MTSENNDAKQAKFEEYIGRIERLVHGFEGLYFIQNWELKNYLIAACHVLRDRIHEDNEFTPEHLDLATHVLEEALFYQLPGDAQKPPSAEQMLQETQDIAEDLEEYLRK